MKRGRRPGPPHARRAVLLAVAVGLMGAGCRSPVPTEPELRPLPPGDPRPASLTDALRERARGIDAVRGRARFALDGPDLEFRRPQRIAAQRDGSLRVETLGLFGQIAAVLVTRAGRYQFLDTRSREGQEGEVSRELLWQLVRIDLDPADVIDLLLGGAVPPEGREIIDAHVGDDGSVRVAFGESGRVVEELGFDAEGRLRRVERVPDDLWLAWQAELDDYREEAGGSGLEVAHEIRVRFPAQDAQASFEFGALELNPPLAPALFALPRLEGRAR